MLCTYNGEAFVAAQLASIESQTYPAHEIIIVDDHSTDGTFSILEALAARNPAIRLYRNEVNLGYNANFEKAFSLARYDVLAPADQDDLWHPQKIARMMAHWPADCPLIYCDSVSFSEEPPQKPTSEKLVRRLFGTNPRQLAVHNTISGHTMLFRRSLLPLALPFHPQVYYDWWLAMVATCNGGVAFCPEILVYRRLHPGNASLPGMDRRTALAKTKVMVSQNLEQFLKTPNIRGEDKAFLERLYQLWHRSLEGKSRLGLFFFLVQNRKLIYAGKKRKLAFFSHLKRSWQYARG